MGGQIQRQVRRRLGRLPRARLRKRQKELGWIPAPGTELTPRDPTMAAWADIPETSAPSSAADGTLRRLCRTHRRAGRQAWWTDWTSAVCARTRSSSTSWGDNGSSAEGQQGSISELLAQNNIPNTVDQQLARRSKNSAACPRSVGPRPTTCITPAGPGPAARRSEHQARRRALRRHAQSARRLLAEGIKPTRTPRSQFTMSTTSRRRSTTSSASRRRKGERSSRRIPIDGTAWPPPSTTPTRPRTNRAVLRQQRQPTASTRMAGMACTFGPLIPWNTPPRCRPRQVGLRHRRLGTL
jgi:hypothetical protein